MKKKIVFAVLLIILIIGSFANFYYISFYNQNLLDYILSNERLTKDEIDYLTNQAPLIFTSDNNAPPLRFVNPDNNQYQGVVIDYIRELSIELGVEINIKPAVWSEALKTLEQSDADLCDMFPSEKRSEKYIFTKPIYFEHGILVKERENDDIKNYKDLENKRIAIQKGDYIEEFLTNELDNIEFVYVNDYEEALKHLTNDYVDVAGGDEPVYSYFLKEKKLLGKYEIVKEPIYKMPAVLALPKEKKKLRDIINKGIIALNKKDTMHRIQQKWFGISSAITSDKSYESLELLIKFFLIIFAIIILLIFFWNKELNRKINKGLKKVNRLKNDLEIVFNALPYYFIIIDDNNYILNVNKSFIDFLGKSKSKILNKKLNSFEIFKGLNRNRKYYKKEFEYKDKVYSLSSFSLADEKVKKNRYLIALEDITEEKLREKQLVHSNKIAALGQLATGVTHEIRNPLGIVRNYTYLIKNDMYKNKSDLLNHIDEIDKALDSVDDFIENLLNFSRISNAKKHKIVLKEFFKELDNLVKKDLEKDNIKITYNIKPALIKFNKESFKHIFLNLISNARDAIFESGKIEIDVEKKDKKVKILFRDTGIGIKKENISKVFDPFYTTKYPGKGTGIGLNIVKKEILENDGEIYINSEYTNGAEFVIILPRISD
ncbi:MAG: transporter substrate-binding domain-containing protein [Bacillota bacterium]